MVNSASNAGKSEYAIRKKMIGDGIIYHERFWSIPIGIISAQFKSAILL